MLTKNSRKILKSICATGSTDRYKRYTIKEVTQLTGLSFDAVITACGYLCSSGYMEIHYVQAVSYPVIDFVNLTELGAHFREVQFADLKKYIATNWIAFLALVVAVISLVRTF